MCTYHIFYLPRCVAQHDTSQPRFPALFYFPDQLGAVTVAATFAAVVKLEIVEKPVGPEAAERILFKNKQL